MKKGEQKNLPKMLLGCEREEEVKSEFAKAFGFKVDTSLGMDLYTSRILFEFKYDRNFCSVEARAKVIAQTLYYIRKLKYGNSGKAIPPIICCIDKNEGFFVETKSFAKIYDSENQKYDWDRAPSTPCLEIVKSVQKYQATKQVHVYSFHNEEDYTNFCNKLADYRCEQLKLDFLEYDKKNINEFNFDKAFSLWDEMFGDYVRNGRKSSEYFVADIQEGKSQIWNNSCEVVFDVGDRMVRKPMPMDKYRYYWETYSKCSDVRTIHGIWQRLDRLTVEDYRRRTGEFYTPIEFASKAISYLEKVVGKRWWEKGYRLWDMAAGTGNLEYELPEEALSSCYLSTLLEDDAKYCSQLYPSATCFQYDYLNDDVKLLFSNHLDLKVLGLKPKMPLKLYNELRDPKLKWIIFINPPFATSNETKKEKILNKDALSMTVVRELMLKEDLGETSRELFSQFIWRISKEFRCKIAYLGMFSKLKYINANNDQKLRDKIFKYQYEKGFVFSSKNFHGNRGQFPVGFLIWNLYKEKKLEDQTITLDIFDENVEKIGIKDFPSIQREALLNKWFKRPRTSSVYPPFSSAINLAGKRSDMRDKVAENFLCSMMSCGNDFQHQNYTTILSGPQSSAGSYSVVPENFEKSMVLYTVRRLPKTSWLNDRDQFLKPVTEDFDSDFYGDCIIWALFSNDNGTVSMKDVIYKGQTYQIKNELYPFEISIVRKWKCSLSTLQNSLNGANKDRYAAIWLKKHKLSIEAQAVLIQAEIIYKSFYEKSSSLAWPKYKIALWDVGWYQIKMSLQEAGYGDEFNELYKAHKKLGNKILPKLYKYGFLQGEAHLFEEDFIGEYHLQQKDLF